MTERSVIVAGPLAFYAKARGGRAFGRARDTVDQARADLAEIDRLLDQCPRHQLPAAVQAAMSIFED
ncbi:hypothetical protein [uncultured Brevundimonas sp.]|jgi:hypothetical protein|uniref:hypothetical protein n=1 Tax=uncultured Brevundimonas sp. TaxID=213418 RepID=UPI00260AE0F6|nr:hypothetical protein [uncultured Brevundimonas sp.]